jgi:hypothetical protein
MIKIDKDKKKRFYYSRLSVESEKITNIKPNMEFEIDFDQNEDF